MRPAILALLGCQALAAAGLAGCSKEAGPRDAGSPAAAPGAWFQEVSARAGVRFRHRVGRERRLWFPEILGAGLGWGDVDDDGFLDLYLVQSGDLEDPTLAPEGNRLFRNRTDGTFEDVTEGAGVGDRGYGMGCTFGDVDNDGHLDLYVTNFGPNVLYRNRGGGSFEDATARARVGDARWGTSCAFADYDADGDLDLFVVNYVNWSKEREVACSSTYAKKDYCSPRNYSAPAADVLYRNEGGGVFTDVSEAAGITRSFGNGLGLGVGDFDGDGRLDFYVANDQMPNQLWINHGDGTFGDEALLAGCAVDKDGKAEAGMGCMVFDYQEDGDLDLFLTHLEGETNTLYVCDAGQFSEVTDRAGLAAPSLKYTGFGVGCFDFDLDGWRDLFVANGRVIASSDSANPLAEANQLFRGLDGERFEEVPLELPAGISRGAAFGDYDNDGDVDLAYSDNDGTAKLLQNLRQPGGHWLELRVLDEHGKDALGALVRVDRGALRRTTPVQVASSYCSSNDPRVHFGLGGSSGALQARVSWLDGTQESFGPLEVDRQHVLRKGAGRSEH